MADPQHRPPGSRYGLAATDPVWAARVIPPHLLAEIEKAGPVRVIVDAGRIEIITLDGWASPERLETLIRLVVTVAGQVHAAG